MSTDIHLSVSEFQRSPRLHHQLADSSAGIREEEGALVYYDMAISAVLEERVESDRFRGILGAVAIVQEVRPLREVNDATALHNVVTPSRITTLPSSPCRLSVKLSWGRRIPDWPSG